MQRVMEETFTFPCEGSQLVGIIHKPARCQRHGVLVIVGGPQYRVGSHRQFTLLARRLAGAGIAVMRFDYRGMGDSEGAERSFEALDSDIAAAVQVFLDRVEGLASVALWGLCDAASAALFYAPQDARVSGLVLLNPWVRSESGAARAYIKHYYLQRIFSRELWSKILHGKLDFRESLISLAAMLRKAVFRNSGDSNGAVVDESFQARMCRGLEAFSGPVMLILSGNQDYVADEFRDLINASPEWKKTLARDSIERIDFAEANHTFSRREWRDRVADWTVAWVEALESRER